MTTPYIFPQSHSSLSTFETCPRQYEAKYILKLECMQFVETDATRWGNAVHRQQELYVPYLLGDQRGSDELRKMWSPELTHYKTGVPMRSYLPAAEWVAKRCEGGKRQPILEDKFGLSADGQAAPYVLRNGWVRGKIDVVLLGDEVADIIDWKTGKKKDDPKQLALSALLIFAAYPNVQKVNVGYAWLGDDGTSAIDKPTVYTRSDVQELYMSVRRRFAPLAQAYETGVFPAKTSGLCYGWCQNTTCEHWKPKKEKR